MSVRALVGVVAAAAVTLGGAAAGCGAAKGLYDIEQDPEKALSTVRDQFENAWVYEQQVRDLGAELQAADSSRDQSVILGRAAVCFAADQTAPD